MHVEDLIKLRRVGAVTPAPDGTWAAVAIQRLDADDESKYVSDIWRVPLEGGEPRQLTRGPWNDSSPAFRSDGSLCFLSNRPTSAGKPEDGHDKRSQVWCLPVDGGEPEPLTDEPWGVDAFAVATHGDRMITLARIGEGPLDEQRETAAKRGKHGPTALHYTKMPVRFWMRWRHNENPHLIAYDSRGENRIDLTPDDVHERRFWVELSLSPDGNRLVTQRAVFEDDRRAYRAALELFELAGETPTSRIIADEPRGYHWQARWAPDSSRLAVARHIQGRGRFGAIDVTICNVDEETPRLQPATTREKFDVMPTIWDWSTDGSAVIVTADRDGFTPVFTVDATSGEVCRITTDRAGGSHGGVSTIPGQRAVIGVRSRFTEPPHVFVASLESGTEPQAIAPELSGADLDALRASVEVSTHSVEGAGGTQVQYWLLSPPSDSDEPEVRPTLMWIHGGPMGQWGDGWHWRWNALAAVARGYRVALPNPRGSTGAGQSFIEGVWGNRWGAECYQDLMAVADALEAHPGVDGDRMVAMGGSFGGYMTNWIGGNTDRFKCLVTHASVFDMSAFYGVTDNPAFWLEMHALDDVLDDDRRASLVKYSPHRFVKHWTTPCLVVHGALDYRCPVGESLALFEYLQSAGVDSELLIFPDEGHWIMRPNNAVAWYDTVLGYIDRQLGHEPS